MDGEANRFHFLSRHWTILATISFILSGALALLITLAKVPGFKELVRNIEFVRWCLIEHVNLATLVWYSAVPVTLCYLLFPAQARVRTRWILLGSFGWGIAASGVLFMLGALPGEGVVPILSNYIPMIVHPRYSAGIAAYLFGTALALLPIIICAGQYTQPIYVDDQMRGARIGAFVGAVYFFSALASFTSAALWLRTETQLNLQQYYENLMWGGGHLLQHFGAVFLIVAWSVLLKIQFPKWVYIVLGIPAVVSWYFLGFSPTEEFYRRGYTLLMQWGIFPPVLYASVLVFKNIKDKNRWSDHRVLAGWLSACLMILGFIFGAFIRGNDLRVPSHYHATIGAVTIVFMAVAFEVLVERHSHKLNQRIGRSILLYGLGQGLFAVGMFTAGSFGMSRKTYGSEHGFTQFGQYAGIAIVAVGGIVAVIGGYYFIRAMAPSLKLSFAKKREGALKAPSLTR